MEIAKFTEEELEELVKSEDTYDRVTAAKQGYGLDVLVND